MPPDLSKLSDAHFAELQAANGDLTKLSDEAFDALSKLEPPANKGSAARIVGQAAQGVNEGVLRGAASPLDISGAIAKGVGLVGPQTPPISDAFVQASDDLASLPLRLRDAISQRSVSPIFAPRDAYKTRHEAEGAVEKFAYGAGKGAGTALTMILPAAAVSRGAQAGSNTQRIAEVLARQPVMQGVSSAVGGGTAEATESPYAGLAAALAVPVGTGLLSRAVSPMPPARTAAEVERRALVDAALARNIPLTSGQISGNKGVQTLESVLENLPLSGGMQRGMIDRQRQVFNQEVTASTGAPLPAFTRAERETRRADLGRQFENLSQGTTVNLDRQFTTQLNDALTRYRQQLPPDVYRNVEQRLSALIDASMQPGNPQISGEIYQRIRSSLGTQATRTGNTETGAALREARGALDAAARRSLPPDVAAEWDTVRRQWGNLKTIEAGMQNADAAVGNIAPRALGAAVDAANRRGGARSLTEISDIGRRILAPQIADSGTAQRGFWQNLATLGAMGSGGLWAGGLPGAAAIISAPPIVQKSLEYAARSGYTGNRLLGNVETLPSREMVKKIGLAQALLGSLQ